MAKGGRVVLLVLTGAVLEGGSAVRYVAVSSGEVTPSSLGE